MSKEKWVGSEDILEQFDPTRPWPDQRIEVDGEVKFVPAAQNYTYGNRAVPAARHRDELVRTVFDDNPVVVLAGNTGSGKTTQSVQMIHEADPEIKIIQTQPRILLARNACYRVRQEMAYANGEPRSADHIVGYATGDDSDLDKRNKIIMATHGKASRWIINHLEEYRGGIFIPDEWHLREINADILTALCAKNGIKMVLSSATMNTEKVSEMFADRNGDPAPIIEIKNRQHKIHEIDPGENLIEDIVKYAPKHDTMVFLSGRKNINSVLGKATRKMSNLGFTNALSLHGQQTRQQQQRVFDKSQGLRTIYSTNVGEMGVTPDVDVLINPGYERAPILIDGVRTLTERPASQAKNKQRAGRTGRTRDGIVVFGSKMEGYPKLPPMNQLREYDDPDILLMQLDDCILQIALMGETIDSLPFPTRPEQIEIERAQIRLRRYGAFDDQNNLTDIGKKMGHSSLSASFARSFVESEKYQDTLPRIRVKMAALAAVQQADGIVSTDRGQEGWRNVALNDSLSDPIHALNVFVWANSPKRTQAELLQKGIIEPKFRRAKERFLTVCKAEGIDPETLRGVTDPEEKEAIVGCLIAGAEEVFVRSGRDSYIDARGDKRYMQSGSAAGKGAILIGMPWNLQTYKAEMLHTNRYITSPTIVTRKQLEMYAPHRCTYAVSGYAMDQWGSITAKRGLYFDGQFVDDKERISTVPSAELRDYMVESLFEKSILRKNELPQNIAAFCKQIAEVRYQEHKVDFNLAIEKKVDQLLETLKSQIPTTVATFEDLNEYIEPSLASTIIDDDDYVEIQLNSPDVINLYVEDEEIAIPVEYHNYQVRLLFTQEQLDYLPESFPQFEGRDVKIKIGGRSRLWTPEQAFERALHPSRAHWRNNVSETPVSLERRPKDEDWDGSSITIPQSDVRVTAKLHRQQHK